MLKGGSRFPVAMADVFPHGCHLVPDSISEAIDYDEETKRRSPASDKLTGKPVFQVRVIDLDPELSGRSREVVVKVIADRMPVPPDLRHGCATFMLAAGVPSRAIMEVLGHSGISVTMNTYAHVLPALRQEAADAIDELFGA